MTQTGRRVLIVEDEYFIASEIAQALEEAGAVVIGPVAERDRALRAVDEEGVDAAVIDINLKGALTFAIADALAARHIPFVFATGYDRGMIPDRHRSVPIWEKPFNASKLASSILPRSSH